MTTIANRELENQALERSLAALLAAAAIGFVSSMAPALALLALVLLGALAMGAPNSSALKAELWSLAGPVLAALAVGASVGLAGAVGVLFLWRAFADARWSASETSRLYRAAGLTPPGAGPLWAHVWLSPLYGLGLVAYTSPHTVAGLPLDLPHVAGWVPLIVAGLLVFSLLDWAMRRAVEWRLGQFAPAPAAHILTHHIAFIAAYGLGVDVSAGIVAMTAWRLAHAAIAARQASLTAVP